VILFKPNIFVVNMDFTILFSPEGLMTLLTLTVMEIVLGIDNVIFISILTGKLPKENQGKARAIGLSLALVFRIGLLFSISWIMGMKEALFALEDFGIDILSMMYNVVNIDQLNAHQLHLYTEINEISGKDLILLGGGLFLMYKSVTEILENFHTHPEEDEDEEDGKESQMSIPSAIVQIIFLDIVFSFDSILAAVGVTKHVEIMVVAVIIALFIMLTLSGKISDFVNENPTIKMLALCFLVVIAALLLVEAAGFHVDKTYLYAAIGFALSVEFLNMFARKAEAKRALLAAEAEEKNHS